MRGVVVLEVADNYKLTATKLDGLLQAGGACLSSRGCVIERCQRQSSRLKPGGSQRTAAEQGRVWYTCCVCGDGRGWVCVLVREATATWTMAVEGGACLCPRACTETKEQVAPTTIVTAAATQRQQGHTRFAKHRWLLKSPGYVLVLSGDRARLCKNPARMRCAGAGGRARVRGDSRSLVCRVLERSPRWSAAPRSMAVRAE